MATYSSDLSLGAKNSTVALFKDLVNYASAGIAEQIGRSVADVALSPLLDYVSSVPSMVSSLVMPKRRIAEFDKSLYDKALSLPEAKTVSFEYSNEVSNSKYGRFKGGNTYKDYEGTIDTSVKLKEQMGWIYIDKSSNEYGLFTCDGKSYIISLKDFEPQPVVTDFYPLYNKLLENRHASLGEIIVNDTISFLSIITSYRSIYTQTILPMIMGAKSMVFDQYYKPISNFITSIDKLTQKDNLQQAKESSYQSNVIWNPFKHSDYTSYAKNDAPYIIQKDNWDPFQHSSYTSYTSKDSQYTIQQDATHLVLEIGEQDPYIYDVPWPVQLFIDEKLSSIVDYQNYIEDVYFYTQSVVYSGGTRLHCFQQPESISYTASAQFDQPTPRGAQIPFSFYQNATGISLNFTLKWHIDEIFSMRDKDNVPLTLEDIAKMAESFTRPVATGGSIKPKIVYVLLPGISRMGYMTEAQITYKGDITSQRDSSVYKNKDYTKAYGTLKLDRDELSQTDIDKAHNKIVCYNQIEVTFSLFVINDVNLSYHKYTKGNTTLTKKVWNDREKTENYKTDDDFSLYSELSETSVVGSPEAPTPGVIMNALGNLYNDITNGISNVLPDAFKEAFGGSAPVDDKATSDTTSDMIA